MILIDISYALSFFLFTWYSAKLLRDVKGIDQYWHYPQTFFLIIVYCLPIIWKPSAIVIYTIIQWGVMFPFIFNSGLNAYRKLPIRHLGKYDWLKWWQTVVLFIFGIILLIIKYFWD